MTARPTRRTLGALTACLLLALALRLPYLQVPLGVDEGGIAAVAQQWGSGHGSLYGADWLDRPPLLVLAFKLAILGGPLGIRALGAAAAVSLVAAVAAISHLLGGQRAAVAAAVFASLLSGSAALAAVYTPGELLAAVPATLSVLCLALAHRRGLARWLVLAGLLAAGAVLVKQSFVDAGCAGAAFFVAGGLRTRAVRWRWLLSYAAGAVVPLVALVVWQIATHPPQGGIGYALVGFRLDALQTLAHSSTPLEVRAEKLVAPALASGLGVALALAPLGFARLRGDRVMAATLGAWLFGGIAGVAGGGSYWSHYLIQLVPVASVTAGIALAAASLRRAVLGVAVAGGLGFAAIAAVHAHRDRPHALEASIGRYVHEHAVRGDTQYVLYAHANVGYYTELPSPYPYAWSLMVRTIPGAHAQLRHLLAGRSRPTWIVPWQPPDRWGLDPDGAVARMLRREYRPVATIDGQSVLLRRGVQRPARN